MSLEMNRRQRARRRGLALECLEDRCMLADPPVGDLTEGNAASWSVFASDSAVASVANDTTRVKIGQQALRFTTASGFDTGVKYPASNDAHWNLTSRNYLKLWAYGDNNTAIGWQGNQPIVTLRSPGGTFSYTPTYQAMSNHAWTSMYVPLAGGDGWTRTSNGTPTLTDVNQIEIHQDTWDAGFKVWYDGVEFLQRDPNALPPAGPAPPAGVNPNAMSPRVLLYVFDPIMENYGGKRLHNAFNWEDGVDLGNRIAEAFAQNSHGLVNYNIVDTVVADIHPYLHDGYQYTDATYANAWLTRTPHSSDFDYPRFVAENNLCARIDSGDLDEVWIYAAPFTNMAESVMGGAGAYWINGPVQNVPCQRAFPMMGLNYEAGFANALHSFGHRSENVLSHTYGDPAATTNWERYVQLASQGGGTGGIGNIHFPVNGTSDYDYANTSAVNSTVNQWANYPNLGGATTSISRTAWQRADGDWHRGYMNYWYSHLPYFAGRGTDFLLNNWWRYLADIDQFKRGNHTLRMTDGLPKVSTTSPTSGAVVDDTVLVRAAAEVEGALGRVDLYVDGVYHSTDAIAPFVFEWNTSGYANGTHTLVTKAYELQNGTEGVSAPVQVQVGAINSPPTITAIGNQTINEDSATALLSFTIADPDHPVSSLTISSQSTNVALAPLSSIAITGTGANRTVRVTPVAQQSGASTITLTVSDGLATASTAFTVTVSAVNDAPTISGFFNQGMNEDAVHTVNFSVADVETPAADLVITVDSSNAALGLTTTLGGNATTGQRTLELRPQTNAFGTTTVTLTVSDGSLTASSSFTLTVSAVNDAPTLALLSDKTVAEDTSTGAIALTISDAETSAGLLQVTASSNNSQLVPASSIALGGSAGNRTLTILPAANQSGTATITVNVSDGALVTSRTFALNVTAVDDPPTLAPLTDRNTIEDSPINVSVTVGDVETPLAGLTVDAFSDAPQLLPLSSFAWIGTGATRTLRISPAAHQFGTAMVTVRVNDGAVTTTQQFNLLVQSVNDPPAAIVLTSQQVRERVPGAIVGDVSATDPDPGDTHTWSVDDSRFEIVAGQLKLKAGEWLDRAQANQLTLSITARDSSVPPLERTEQRQIAVVANPFPWQNPLRAFDVDDDGEIVPLDGLWIILDLNARGPRALVVDGASWPPLYLDPSGDNFISPLDALLVINHLNSGGNGEAEQAFTEAPIPDEKFDWRAAWLWNMWEEEL